MRIQKKLLSILFVITMILGITACSSIPNETDSESKSKTSASSDEIRKSSSNASTDTSIPNETNSENKSKTSAFSDESRKSNANVSTDTSIPTTKNEANASANSSVSTRTDTQPKKSEETIKIKVTVGEQVLTATLIDNATTRSLISKLPLTVPMMNLYSREMCYRFPDELPTDNVQTTGYEVGEIVYWPPRHSFVILYAQNGEHFDMQKFGRIDSGVEIFKQTGDVNVKFELLDK